MATHRWTSSTRLQRHDTGETIQPGDVFDPTESELSAFGDDIERLDDADTTLAEATTDEVDADAGRVDDASAASDHIEYEDQTMDELYTLAQERDISGRSEMDKSELIDALRDE